MNNRFYTLTAVKERYSAGRSLLKLKGSPMEQLDVYLNQVGVEAQLIEELISNLRTYARRHLNQNGTGDNYTVDAIYQGEQEITPHKSYDEMNKAIAINKLLSLIRTASAEQIYQFVTNPSFQKLAGFQEIHFNLFKKSLSDHIKTFINAYQKFREVRDSGNLVEILLDQEVCSRIKPRQLADLFWYVNPNLVAEIIVHIYKNKLFLVRNYPKADIELNFSLLENFLAQVPQALEAVNAVRCQLKSDIFLPDNVKCPGRDSATEVLTAQELFQYDETTILAVEQFLLDKHASVLANRIQHQMGPEKTTPMAPYLFYLIPAGPYMLLDPVVYEAMPASERANTNYFRYMQFKTDLRELVFSYHHQDLKKPLIFCGIINIDGNHYLPYFIYKNENNVIDVVVIDPSPRMHAGNDSKAKTHAKVVRIFMDVFPGCRVMDPGVNLMLRERDCGPNAATTLDVVMNASLSAVPLLQIVNGYLNIEKARIPHHYSPIMVDPYQDNAFLYPKELEQVSLANRGIWSERLSNIKQVNNFVRIKSHGDQGDSLPMSIHDEYATAVTLEYHYDHLTASQDHQDTRDVNISGVQALLLSDERGAQLIRDLVADYRRNYRFPSPQAISEFLESKIENIDTLQLLASAHEFKLELLVEDVLTLILREDMPQAMVNLFRTEILENLPAQDDLDSEVLVKNFLEITYPQIYAKLTGYQQQIVKFQLKDLADMSVKDKLTEIYLDRAKELIKRNMRSYLAAVPVDISRHDIINYLLQQPLSFWKDQENAMSALQIDVVMRHLLSNARGNLNAILSIELRCVAEQLVEATAPFIVKASKIVNTPLHIILNYFDEIDNGYSGLAEEELALLLPSNIALSSAMVLSADECKSCLLNLVYEEINKKFEMALKGLLPEKVELFVEEFFTRHQLSLPYYIRDKFPAAKDLLAMQDAAEIPDHLIKDLVRNFQPTDENIIQHVAIYDNIFNLFKVNLQKITRLIFIEKYTFLADDIIETVNLHDSDTHFFNAANARGVTTNILQKFLQCSEKAALIQENFKCKISDQTGEILINDAASYEDFLNWFTENHVHFVQLAYQQLLPLEKQIAYAELSLRDLISLLTISYPDMARTLSDAHASLTQLSNQLNQLRLEMHAPLTVARFKQYFQDNFAGILNSLMENYKLGDYQAGSVAAIIRPTLCQLLQISTSRILLPEQVKPTDQLIIKKLKTFDVEGMNIGAQKTLLPLLPQSQLPDTYGKPVTLDLLIQCVQLYFSDASNNHFQLRLGFGSNLPALIMILIQLINDYNHLHVAEMLMPILQAESEQLDCFLTKDKLSKIKAALLRSNEFCNTEETEIAFSEVRRYLALNEAIPSVVSLTEDQIQQAVLAEIMNLRNRNPNSAAALDHDLIRERAIKRLLGIESPPDFMNHQLTTQPVDVRRKQITKIRPFGLFAETLSPIEKELLNIQAKHGDVFDFKLDANDITRLQKLLEKRKNALGLEGCLSHYLYNPTREDKVYILFAEVLAKQARMTGKLSFTYCYLFPVCERYPDLSALKQTTFPASICELELTQEEQELLKIIRQEGTQRNQPEFAALESRIKDIQETTCIDQIPIDKLIITRSGYAFSIDWILHAYVHNQHSLNNFYTGKIFTFPELDDICQLPRSIQFLNAVKDAIDSSNGMTPESLNMLIKYLNATVFDRGFSQMYTSSQNEAVARAGQVLLEELNTLSLAAQRNFWNESIPCTENLTIEKIFERSRGSCLTYLSTMLARVVIAYLGNGDRLDSASLVYRAQEYEEIERRQFVGDLRLNQNMQNLNAEDYLYARARRTDFTTTSAFSTGARLS